MRRFATQVASSRSRQVACAWLRDSLALLTHLPVDDFSVLRLQFGLRLSTPASRLSTVLTSATIGGWNHISYVSCVSPQSLPRYRLPATAFLWVGATCFGDAEDAWRSHKAARSKQQQSPLEGYLHCGREQWPEPPAARTDRTGRRPHGLCLPRCRTARTDLTDCTGCTSR